jgi:hypothetical protein
MPSDIHHSKVLVQVKVEGERVTKTILIVCENCGTWEIGPIPFHHEMTIIAAMQRLLEEYKAYGFEMRSATKDVLPQEEEQLRILTELKTPDKTN